MRYVQFVFLREGSSDDALLPHLEDLLVREGADEAVGEAREYRGTIQSKISKFLEEDFPVDLIFVHRDADAAGRLARETEIFEAAGMLTDCPPVIPVVPIHETEAWGLVDHSVIRSVAGNPGGVMDLGIPPLSQIESVGDPKQRLKDALRIASGLTGADLKELAKGFNANRAAVLNRLDTDGDLGHLTAWTNLVGDIQLFIARTPRSSP